MEESIGEIRGGDFDLNQVDRTRLGIATLASENKYTLFSFGERTLKFRSPRSLKRYRRVNKWNAGYIEVETEYNDCVEEEYIDLKPILLDLCIEPAEFLTPIKKVEVCYA